MTRGQLLGAAVAGFISFVGGWIVGASTSAIPPLTCAVVFGTASFLIVCAFAGRRPR